MTGYEALRISGAWIDLSGRGQIRVTGEDRARLLHAMSTNDINNLAVHDGLYAFFLTAQGRIIADAYIYNLGDSFLLDTEPETGTKLCEHLNKFIIADDVSLEDQTDQRAVIGLEGPNSLEQVKALGVPVPDKQYSAIEWESGFVVRVAATGFTGLRIFIPSSRKDEILRDFRDHGILNATFEEARIVRIENGIPRYGEDISDRCLVHETQQLHGVHANKGCYLGQEIVERVRSRGQVHRLLTRVHIKSDSPPASGTKLTLDGKDVAEIASAVYSPALREVVGLAYVRTEVAAKKPEMVVAGPVPETAAYLS